MAHTYYSKKIIIAKIISNKKISDAHYILTIQDAWLATHFSAGQFVMLKTQDATTDPLLKRPFTIFSVDGDMVSVFYCVCGPATNLLAAKKSGETIEVLGPLGNGFSLKEMGQNNVSEVFLVGGGCGVATLFVLAGELKKLDCKINLYIGARTAKYICCAENFASLNIKINIATDDGSLGFKGYLPDLLLTHLQEQDNFNNKYIFASGPK